MSRPFGVAMLFAGVDQDGPRLLVSKSSFNSKDQQKFFVFHASCDLWFYLHYKALFLDETII